MSGCGDEESYASAAGPVASLGPLPNCSNRPIRCRPHRTSGFRDSFHVPDSPVLAVVSVQHQDVNRSVVCDGSPMAATTGRVLAASTLSRLGWLLVWCVGVVGAVSCGVHHLVVETPEEPWDESSGLERLSPEVLFVGEFRSNDRGADLFLNVVMDVQRVLHTADGTVGVGGEFAAGERLEMSASGRLVRGAGLKVGEVYAVGLEPAPPRSTSGLMHVSLLLDVASGELLSAPIGVNRFGKSGFEVFRCIVMRADEPRVGYELDVIERLVLLAAASDSLGAGAELPGSDALAVRDHHEVLSILFHLGTASGYGWSPRAASDVCTRLAIRYSRATRWLKNRSKINRTVIVVALDSAGCLPMGQFCW